MREGKMVSSRRDFVFHVTGMLAAGSSVARMLTAQEASTPGQLSGAGIATKIQALKPGEYLWAATIAPAGPVLAIVSLPVQRMYVYRNGLLIAVTTVSTGTKGRETPTGVFTVLQKKVKHNSNLYNSAPMPYMQRLTWDGIAMHAGHLPGYAASHGCVRLPMAFAKQLYGVTKLGMTVVITDQQAVPRVAPTPELLESEAAIAAAVQGAWTWEPEKSPTGPMSLILSGADRRLVVLRNGVLIGSTPVEITGPIKETMAFSLSKMDAQGFHWLQLPLPGQSWTGSRELSAEQRERVRIPDEFRSALDGELTPGVTLVVTPDSLQAGGTGKSVTVVEAEAGTT
jgi:hypothetical protein